MTKNILKLSCIALAILFTSCTKEPVTDDGLITFRFNHPNSTKATDTSFEQNDKVGLFLTDSDKILESAGNFVTNNMLSFDGANWNPASKMYWNEGTYNAYAYYPYMTPVESITDLPISVSLDQAKVQNYSQSDFLWAAKEKITASNTSVDMTFSHRMSRLYVELAPSEDYSGSIPEDAQVFVHNVITDATVDLRVGIVTANNKAEVQTLQTRNMGNNRYSAIIVPQRISSRVPLIEVIMDGVSYLYESSFIFKSGIQHNVKLIISKNPSQIKIDIGGEVGDWSN